MAMAISVPRYTLADLERFPDDGSRYELLDGVLIVTPSPAWQHQNVVTGLWLKLRLACPADMIAFVAPLDVVYGDLTVLQPDVLVVRRADLGERTVAGPPVLAVEVLSPSTRHLDLAYKRARYEEAGCPSYWVIDPLRPSIVCWDLVDGVYEEVARATGDEQVTLQRPYPVTLAPAELVA